MPSKKFENIAVIYDSPDRETASLVGDAVSQTLSLVQTSWGLGAPHRCRIYLMTSWWGFIFQSAPWTWKILLAITFPLWCFRARRTWPYSAAWTQAYGKYIAIGIKPPHLLEASDKSIGLKIFVREDDMRLKIRHLTCHELTHACSAHLKFPAWLNEGLAVVTVDRLLAKPTIRTDTLEMLRSHEPFEKPPTYRQLSRSNMQTIAYHAVISYWLVHYLEEVRPGFLKRLLTSTPQPSMFDRDIAGELGMDPGSFWREIPTVLASHYEGLHA